VAADAFCADEVRLSGVGHHLVVGADGRGCQEERVLAAYPAEVDLEARFLGLPSSLFCLLSSYFFSNLPYPYRTIIMDAGFFSPLKVVIGAVVEPAPGVLLVIEPDGPDGPSRIAFATRFRYSLKIKGFL